MKTYGLLGYPLSHSFSQKYFTDKFKKDNISDCEFKNFELESIHKLPQLLRSTPTLCGLSVTIPYKKKVIDLLDKLSKTAKEIDAVNCIKIDKQTNQLIGYNTDYEGFEKSLKPLLQKHHTNALILGTGGAAKAVAYSLGMLKIKFRYVSRNILKTSSQNSSYKVSENSMDLSNKSVDSYADLDENKMLEHPIIINTTPLGMHPNLDGCPDIPYQFLTNKHLLYDLTYNPAESKFLRKGKEKGAQIKNGLEMLHLQAEKAWEIWNS